MIHAARPSAHFARTLHRVGRLLAFLCVLLGTLVMGMAGMGTAGMASGLPGDHAYHDRMTAEASGPPTLHQGDHAARHGNPDHATSDLTPSGHTVPDHTPMADCALHGCCAQCEITWIAPPLARALPQATGPAARQTLPWQLPHLPYRPPIG